MENLKETTKCFIPIAKNSKKPLINWQTKENLFSYVQLKKLFKERDINLALELSSLDLLVIDIDDVKKAGKLFDYLKNLYKKYKNRFLVVRTKRGYHFYFKLSKDEKQLFHKKSIRHEKYSFDIQGGKSLSYCLIPPSQRDGFFYQIIGYKNNTNKLVVFDYFFYKIKKYNFTLPEKLKQFLLKFYNNEINTSIVEKQNIKKIFPNLKQSDFTTINKDALKLLIKDDVPQVDGEGRNNYLVHIAGKLRTFIKDFHSLTLAVYTINNEVFKEPLPYREVEAMLKKQFDYLLQDVHVIKNSIMELFNTGQYYTKTEILKRVKGEDKLIEKILTKLVKDGIIVKIGKYFVSKEKPKFQVGLIEEKLKPVNFRVPYFEDVGYFYDTDMILIGMKTGRGKTHLAINIAYELIKQGKNVYYYYLESGSRYLKIMRTLSDDKKFWQKFFHTNCSHVLNIELEKDAISIIDWLCLEDFAKTEQVFKYLDDEIKRKGGFLFVFVQLKENGEFFAKNLIKNFVALASRYNWVTEDGLVGKFIFDKIRDAKLPRIKEIICNYDFERKRLLTKEIKYAMNTVEINNDNEQRQNMKKKKEDNEDNFIVF